ncbi:unnamed protein product [Anisakis simplex]|uniref:DUF1758 domain-containing protein n=1 Tax=Anisakis simplex TaxID=6269 RepID=A0A0M3K3B6_ANISI|nr:unnamed protein product [Anisakis simplex]
MADLGLRRRSYDDTLSKAALEEMAAPNVVRSSIQLSILGLLQFNSDPLKWPEFWTIFQAVVGSKTIPEITKLNYLLNCLVGAAKATASGYAIVPENYDEVVVNMLRQRQLEILGDNINHPQIELAIEEKLPKWLLLEIYTKKSADPFWSVKKLRNYIEEAVTLREMVDRYHGYSEAPNTNRTNQKDVKYQGSHKSFITDDLAQQLRLKCAKEKEDLRVSRFGEDKSKRSTQFLSLHKNSERAERWTDVYEASISPNGTWRYPQILIGADYFCDFMLPASVRKLKCGFQMMNSSVGWMLTGKKILEEKLSRTPRVKYANSSTIVYLHMPIKISR